MSDGFHLRLVLHCVNGNVTPALPPARKQIVGRNNKIVGFDGKATETLFQTSVVLFVQTVFFQTFIFGHLRGVACQSENVNITRQVPYLTSFFEVGRGT